MTERIVPQQYAGQRPPKGWVPPLGQDLTLLGVYDNESGYWMGLPLQILREALLTAESLHTEDRIDERDKIELNLVTEAEVSGNIRVSKFPKTDTVDKKYLGTDLAASQNEDYDLASAGQLGADLRLVGGDKLTVVGTVTAVGGTTADRKVTLNLYGRKARRLV